MHLYIIKFKIPASCFKPQQFIVIEGVSECVSPCWGHDACLSSVHGPASSAFQKECTRALRKTQELLLVVWLLRYLDLLSTFYSMYNSFMKLFYISSTVLILIVMYHDPVRSTCNIDHDSMKHWMYMFAPTAIIGSAITIYSSVRYDPNFGYIDNTDIFEMGRTVSIMLEPVALIPQAFMYHKYRRVQSLAGGSFLLLSGMYRFLYILNWVYQSHTQQFYRHRYLLYVCGVAQATVGIGGACFGNDRGRAPLGPQLIHFYKSFKVGWVVTVLFLLGMSSEADITRDVSLASEEHQMTVVALLILSVVAVLALICYCGFSTYKEETTELESPLLDAADASEGQEQNETKPKKKKKGIFIHGIQVV